MTSGMASGTMYQMGPSSTYRPKHLLVPRFAPYTYPRYWHRIHMSLIHIPANPFSRWSEWTWNMITAPAFSFLRIYLTYIHIIHTSCLLCLEERYISFHYLSMIKKGRLQNPEAKLCPAKTIQNCCGYASYLQTRSGCRVSWKKKILNMEPSLFRLLLPHCTSFYFCAVPKGICASCPCDVLIGGLFSAWRIVHVERYIVHTYM